MFEVLSKWGGKQVFITDGSDDSVSWDVTSRLMTSTFREDCQELILQGTDNFVHQDHHQSADSGRIIAVRFSPSRIDVFFGMIEATPELRHYLEQDSASTEGQ